MTKWEYLSVQVGWMEDEKHAGRIKYVNGQVDKRLGEGTTSSYDAFNILGSEGWELVAINSKSTNSRWEDSLYYFKRLV